MSKMNEEELRNEIASIIYGADWKERYIANAFMPDVEAAMELIHSYTQEKCREARLDEIRLLDHRGFMPIGNNDFKYDVYQSDLDRRIAQLNKSKGE